MPGDPRPPHRALFLHNRINIKSRISLIPQISDNMGKFNHSNTIRSNIFNLLKTITKPDFRKMIYLDTCACGGDLKHMWGELKRKRSGNPNYINKLYTNDNSDKTAPIFIIHILTKYMPSTFYKNIETASIPIALATIFSTPIANYNVINDENYGFISTLIGKRYIPKLTQYFHINSMRDSYISIHIAHNAINLDIDQKQ